MLENEYVNQLEEIFIKNGWKTYREVIPDECKSWSKPFKVDLVVYKEEVGFIGIEAKSISMRQGGILAKAHKQIQKYRNKHYFDGKEINLWAVAVKFNHPEQIYVSNSAILIREFFCAYGIGYVFLEDRSYKSSSVDFGYSQAWAKIPFDLSNKKMDIDRIIRSQHQKGDV